MAFYHVSNCDCPIGCCCCESPNSKLRTVFLYYDIRSDNLLVSAFAPARIYFKNAVSDRVLLDSWEEDRNLYTCEESSMDFDAYMEVKDDLGFFLREG